MPRSPISAPPSKTLNQMMVSGDRIGIWWHPDMAAEQDKYAHGAYPGGGFYAHSAGTGCAGVSDYRREEVMLPVPVYKLIPRRIIAGMGCRRDTGRRGSAAVC